MKQNFLFISACILFLACNNNSSQNYEPIPIVEPVEEEVVAEDPAVVIEKLKTKVANEIKSWGAKDAYFNEENYFVYCLDPSEISGSASDVASAMYPIVTEVPGVKGCIVVNYKTNKELGRYEAQ